MLAEAVLFNWPAAFVVAVGIVALAWAGVRIAQSMNDEVTIEFRDPEKKP